jgi:hypothetical protein
MDAYCSTRALCHHSCLLLRKYQECIEHLSLLKLCCLLESIKHKLTSLDRQDSSTLNPISTTWSLTPTRHPKRSDFPQLLAVN